MPKLPATKNQEKQMRDTVCAAMHANGRNNKQKKKNK